MIEILVGAAIMMVGIIIGYAIGSPDKEKKDGK